MRHFLSCVPFSRNRTQLQCQLRQRPVSSPQQPALPLHPPRSGCRRRGNSFGELDVVVLYGDGTGAGGDGARIRIAGTQITKSVGGSAVDPVADHHPGAQWKLREPCQCSVHYFILGRAKVRSSPPLGDNGCTGVELCRRRLVRKVGVRDVRNCAAVRGCQGQGMC